MWHVVCALFPLLFVLGTYVGNQVFILKHPAAGTGTPEVPLLGAQGFKPRGWVVSLQGQQQQPVFFFFFFFFKN